MLVRQLLETVGFEAKEAANGEEAIALCESWHPQLILMDMRMPVMDGYEATQRIKASAEGQATIIVALTASALEEERSAILAVGCDDYIRKPFRDVDLFARLAHHLGARYTYADEGESAEKEGGRAAQESLTSQTLAALPAEWIVELHDAAGRGRADLILNLVARMEHEYPLIAGGLAQLVDEFRFDRIMRLTERQEGVQP
jgi:CheY-like chemotaxis protein